jgi:hypothetical protein
VIGYQSCTDAVVRASLPRADALHHLRIEHFLRLLELVHEAAFATVTFASAKHHARRFRTLSDRLHRALRERQHERERREREKRENCHNRHRAATHSFVAAREILQSKSKTIVTWLHCHGQVSMHSTPKTPHRRTSLN